MLRIGVISDTHGLLRPEAVARLAGADHIIHAGDIGSPEIIAGLRTIAPVTAIRGNIDKAAWARDYPETEFVKLGGHWIYVLHNLGELDLDPGAAGIDVVISGHSHRPKVETVGGGSISIRAAPGRGGSPCPSRWRRSSWTTARCGRTSMSLPGAERAMAAVGVRSRR